MYGFIVLLLCRALILMPSRMQGICPAVLLIIQPIVAIAPYSLLLLVTLLLLLLLLLLFQEYLFHRCFCHFFFARGKKVGFCCWTAQHAQLLLRVFCTMFVRQMHVNRVIQKIRFLPNRKAVWHETKCGTLRRTGQRIHNILLTPVSVVLPKLGRTWSTGSFLVPCRRSGT